MRLYQLRDRAFQEPSGDGAHGPDGPRRQVLPASGGRELAEVAGYDRAAKFQKLRPLEEDPGDPGFVRRVMLYW